MEPVSPCSFPAPGKLNLMLRVIGRRADGYHLIQSVIRFIDYGDTVTVRVRGDGADGDRDGTGAPDDAGHLDDRVLVEERQRRAVRGVEDHDRAGVVGDRLDDRHRLALVAAAVAAVRETVHAEARARRLRGIKVSVDVDAQ